MSSRSCKQCDTNIKICELLSSSVYWVFLSSSILTRAEIYCFLSLLVHCWVPETSYLHVIIRWKWWYKYRLYGLVITALFFIGMQSIIYHWQCSRGLMMHNSVGVVWRAAPAEGIWKVIRAINPNFFLSCLSGCSAAANSYDGLFCFFFLFKASWK